MAVSTVAVKSIFHVSMRGYHSLGAPVLSGILSCSNITPQQIENRRYLPKPLKSNKQYKWNFDAVKDQLKEYTHKPLNIPRLGGRDPQTGRKVNQHVGGGIKWDYFVVDKFRFGPTDGSFYDEKVLEIRKDPNRTAYIALVAGTKGKRWLLATENMKVGQIIRTTGYIPPIPIKPPEGDAYPVGAIAIGTQINSVESYPGLGARNIVNAGCFATILRRQTDGMVVIQLPNMHEYSIKPECMATVGRLSNVEHYKDQIGSPNMARRMGIKQSSGLWRRKDGYMGRKVYPLPPTKTIDKPPDEPLNTIKYTLTKRDLNALFGPAAAHPMIHAINQSYPEAQ